MKLDSQSYMAHYYFAAMSLQENDRDHDAEVEASLKAAIKLKPDFAPPYDALARFYGMRDEKLEEAHRLTLQSVGLEPGNVTYRINAANVLIKMKNLNNAETVLNAALKVARTPGETMEIQTSLQQLAQYRATEAASQKAESRPEASPVQTTQTMQTARTSEASGIKDSSVAGGPKKVMVFKSIDGKMVGTAAKGYPEGEAKGPRHTVSGTIRNVQCSAPAVLAFSVEQAGKTVALYTNNFYKVLFTTANYTPEGDIKPCTDIQGMKARVGYAEVKDDRVAGQAVSIELSK